MNAELSALNLSDDYEEVVRTSDAARWELARPAPLEVLAAMAPATTPVEEFQARLLWSRYPEEPPSLKFRDPATGRLDLPTAWPKVRGFRPSSLDACVNYCAEGFGLHPEWRGDPAKMWSARGNPLLFVLRTLQSELDDHFEGRHA